MVSSIDLIVINSLLLLLNLLLLSLGWAPRGSTLQQSLNIIMSCWRERPHPRKVTKICWGQTFRIHTCKIMYFTIANSFPLIVKKIYITKKYSSSTWRFLLYIKLSTRLIGVTFKRRGKLCRRGRRGKMKLDDGLWLFGSWTPGAELCHFFNLWNRNTKIKSTAHNRAANANLHILQWTFHNSSLKFITDLPQHHKISLWSSTANW